MRQVYLAVRLAVANIMNGEKMPLMLDDVVDAADDQQLIGVLKAISTVQTDQTILLTSDKELAARLESRHVKFNSIEL